MQYAKVLRLPKPTLKAADCRRISATSDGRPFIERGIRLLMQSQEAYRALATATEQQRTQLERRAAPYRAWLLTNESFLRRDRGDRQRGWRLFQLAFILAHIPTFASRMPEYRDYYDPLLDEAAASLLYFPTGGGKSEAFYGALLFAMFLDRLRGKARGVTAIIRYPLRLLTLQQGQRLLLLVTAAELVRIDERSVAGRSRSAFGSAETIRPIDTPTYRVLSP